MDIPLSNTVIKRCVVWRVWNVWKCCFLLWHFTRTHQHEAARRRSITPCLIRFEFSVVTHLRWLSRPSVFPKWKKPLPRNKLQTGSHPERHLRVLDSQKRRLTEDHPSYYRQNSGKNDLEQSKISSRGLTREVLMGCGRVSSCVTQKQKMFLRVCMFLKRLRRHWRLGATEAVELNYQEVALKCVWQNGWGRERDRKLAY